jgi:Ni/Co efflux regulator RcnB
VGDPTASVDLTEQDYINELATKDQTIMRLRKLLALAGAKLAAEVASEQDSLQQEGSHEHRQNGEWSHHDKPEEQQPVQRGRPRHREDLQE